MAPPQVASENSAPAAASSPGIPKQHAQSVLFAGGTLLVAGIIHLMVVEAHLTHARGTGLFFLGMGAAQVVWAVMFIRQPTWNMARFGLPFLAIAPTILYVVTRVVRAPWSEFPEHVDTLGVATVAFQLLAAAALTNTLWARLGKQLAAAAGVGLLAGATMYGGALAVEDVAWLADAEVPHVHGDDGEHAGGGHGHGGDAWGTVGQSIVGTIPYYGPPTAEGISQQCRDAGQANEDCWLSYLRGLLIADGAVAAFAVLDDLATYEPAASTHSHAMAHTLGHEAFQAYGRDIVLTLGECSYEVFQGCIHGALQSYFDDLGQRGAQVDKSTLGGVCSAAESSFERYSCVHGVGHGVMIYAGYAMDDSLDMCALFDTGFDRSSCYGGVFMENVVAYFDSKRPDYVPHHGNSPPEFWIREDDPAYPCNAVDAPYQSECWRMQTSLILHFNNGDFRATSSVCDDAGTHRLACYASVGRDAKTYTGADPVRMSQHCAHGAPDAQRVCVRAFTAGVSLAANDVQAAIDLCGKLNATYTMHCYEEVGDQARSMLGAAEAEELCNGLPDAYQKPCHEGRQ